MAPQLQLLLCLKANWQSNNGHFSKPKKKIKNYWLITLDVSHNGKRDRSSVVHAAGAESSSRLIINCVGTGKTCIFIQIKVRLV